MRVRDAIDIAIQIAEGLQAAHQKGIIHRDVKSANIMITPAGQVKITDFGLAKQKGEASLTKSGSQVGTAAYMSPEQVKGQQADQQSDLFSFGIVLYEMLTGQLPFTGESDQALMFSILYDPHQLVTALCPHVPAALAQIVEKALRKDKKERYQFAGEILAELQKLSKDTAGSYQHIDEPVVDGRRLQKGPKLKGQPWDAGTRIAALWKKRSAFVVSAILFCVLSIALVAYFFVFSGDKQAAAERKMIVVLPFENLGPADDDFFVDGLTDAITAKLASLQNLGVISRQSAIQYKKSDKSPQEISEELGGVQYILEGTVQRENPSDPTSRARIIPQLIDVSDNTHLWAETYDDAFREVFQVQSNIAEGVAQALKVLLNEGERGSLAARPTENLEAYELYIRAGKYDRTRLEEIRIAVQLLERAIELDSQFALAYVRLSQFQSGAFFFGQDRSETRRTRAKEAVDHALELNPELPEAHLALGYYYYEGEGDYERALKEFAIARRGLPSEVSILFAEALIWRRQGKLEETAENLKKALARLTSLPLEAFSSRPWFITRMQLLGEVYLALGDTLQAQTAYDSARVFLERKVAQYPDDPRLRCSLGLVYAGLGRKQDAMREGRLAVELAPVSRDYMHGLTSLENLARIYVAVGETKLALEQLEYLLSASYGTFVSRALLRLDTRWDPLRGNPGFKRLLEKS